MEENQQEASMALVPIESFSYSWLVNFPSLEASLDDNHQTYEDSSSCSFIEMDPRLPPSRRFFINKAHESSFKFDTFVSFSDEDHTLVHADDIFRDGYVMPYLSKATSAMIEYEPLDTKVEKKMETRDTQSKSPCRKLRRVSKCVLLRYLDFLTPLCKRLRRCRASDSSGGRSRVATLSRSRVYSEETTSLSPRISGVDDCYWRRSCDSESSIYEAVLHCKKSFEK